MLRVSATIASLTMLVACNMASFSHSPEKFQSIDRASFKELMTYNFDPNKGDKTTFGPKIAYSMGSYGGLATVKKADGRLLYKFYGRLEYSSYAPRRYDTVIDVSGRKLPFKTGRVVEANGGYMHEYITVNLSKEQLTEAKFDGLFFTFSAREHEKKIARSNRSRELGIGELLALANEVKGGSNHEYKNNDNYDVSVPPSYIDKFLSEINK